MKETELLDLVLELKLDLYSSNFRNKVKEQSDEHQQEIFELRKEVRQYSNQLENYQYKVIADKLDELAPKLLKGIDEVQNEIENLNNINKFLSSLHNVAGLISRIITPL